MGQGIPEPLVMVSIRYPATKNATRAAFLLRLYPTDIPFTVVSCDIEKTVSHLETPELSRMIHWDYCKLSSVRDNKKFTCAFQVTRSTPTA